MTKNILSFLTFFLLFTSGVIAEEGTNTITSKTMENQDWHNLIITDSTASTKCNRLLAERNDKIKQKQKISYLVMQTKKLLDKANENQKTVTRDLEEILHRLENEGELARLSLQKMTENIILKGCPGISL